jgi:hypothetical protein
MSWLKTVPYGAGLTVAAGRYDSQGAYSTKEAQHEPVAVRRCPVVGVYLIVIGLLTLAWGRWLVPVQLRKVGRRATTRGEAHMDAFFDRPFVRRLFNASSIVGGVAIVVGIAFLLSEL